MIAAAGMLLTLVAAPASAADPKNPTGGPTGSFNYTEDMQPAWKLQLVALHEKQVAGTTSKSDVAAWNAIVAAHAPYLPKLSTSLVGSIAPLTVPSNSIAQVQRSQANDHYCGPASAQSVVLAWNFMKGNPTISMWDGQALSQGALAGPQYTDAERLNATNWNSGTGSGMRAALNWWLWSGHTEQWFYHDYTPSSATSLTSKVTTDIDSGAMLAAATFEPGGIAARHYNGHPVAKTISHWATIYGYYNNGTSISFQDPAYHGLNMTWSAASPYFDLSNSVAFGYMTQYGATFGITW